MKSRITNPKSQIMINLLNLNDLNFAFLKFYPPSQKTTGVSPWRLHSLIIEIYLMLVVWNLEF
jgi:hypothetical protein